MLLVCGLYFGGTLMAINYKMKVESGEIIASNPYYYCVSTCNSQTEWMVYYLWSLREELLFRDDTLMTMKEI